MKRAIDDILHQINHIDNYPTIFELAPNSFLHICTNPCSVECEKFKIMRKKQAVGVSCDKCTYQIKLDGKQQQRQLTDVGKKGDSSSKVNKMHMSSTSSARKNQERKKEI